MFTGSKGTVPKVLHLCTFGDFFKILIGWYKLAVYKLSPNNNSNPLKRVILLVYMNFSSIVLSLEIPGRMYIDLVWIVLHTCLKRSYSITKVCLCTCHCLLYAASYIVASIEEQRLRIKIVWVWYIKHWISEIISRFISSLNYYICTNCFCATFGQNYCCVCVRRYVIICMHALHIHIRVS